MMSEKIKRIVINGGGLHGWSAAAQLAVALKHQAVEIMLLDDGQASHSILSLGTSVHDFHRSLGIQEVDMISMVGGSYKYGTLFRHWCMTNQPEFTHTWSPVGQMINRVPFHHYVSRQHHRDSSVSLEPFSIAATAAGEQRFSHPEPNTPLERLDYSMHLDARNYQEYLRQFALSHGVSAISAQITGVHTDQESGQIVELALDNETRLQADFYIDVTADSQLARNNEFESWEQWFPCDRRLQVYRRSESMTPVVNSITRTEFGWHKTNPIPGARFESVSFCSDLVSDEQVLNSIDGPQGSHHLADSQTGISRQFWDSNVLRLGPAAGCAGDLLFESLHFTHTGLQRWLELYPVRPVNRYLVQQYNQETRTEYEHARDAHAILLATMSAELCDLGRKMATVSWPDSLTHRIELFRETGRVAFYEGDVLDKQQWMQLLIGCGIWPQRFDPMVGTHSDSELEKKLVQTAATVKQTVAKMPPHDALLNAIRNSARH